MSIILDLKRTNLVNKCDPHPIKDPPELLKFYPRGGYWVAYLKEAIARTDDGFTQVSVFRNGEPLTENTDYTVDNEASTITLIGLNTDINNVTATYTGTGSIIWAEDVNELQTAAQVLATNALDKNGDTMSGNLNMGGNNITNPGTVDGVDISTHNHANGQGGLIGTAGLESGAVTSSVLADNSVITSKITDSSVTDVKIESVSVNKVTGLASQFANKYLTNLANGLENVICTDAPTTSATATLQKPVVIVDTRKNSDNSWYKLYSNGWVEMGGLVTVNVDASGSVTFPNSIVLKDISYNVQLTPGPERTEYNNTSAGSVWYRSKTTSGFTIINDLFTGEISWKVEGILAGTTNILVSLTNITNGSQTINTLYTYTLPSNKTLKIDLGGAYGVGNLGGVSANLGGGTLSCTKQFTAGDIIEIKSINNGQELPLNNQPGIGVAVYCNHEPVLIAAGAGYYWNYTPYYGIGGSGYNGGIAYNAGINAGEIYRNGFSIAGGQGNFDGNGGVVKGGSYIIESAYLELPHCIGGNGYIHTNYVSSTTAVSGSSSTGNMSGAYAKISIINS